VQVPGVIKYTVLPNKLQTAVVIDVNATAKPDEAVADKVNVGSAIVLSESGAKVMVCGCNAAVLTAKDCVTCVAAL
jgi:hypothetical protein